MPKPTLVLILLLAPWGCGSEMPVTRDATQVARLILRLSTDIPAAAARDRVRRIATELGIELDYLRPLGGGAHLVAVEGVPGSAQLESIIAELSRRPDVAHIEEDRRRKAY